MMPPSSPSDWFYFCLSLLGRPWFSPVRAESAFSRSTKLMEAECKRLGLDLSGGWAVEDFQELRQKERCRKEVTRGRLRKARLGWAKQGG